ncbi:MAG: iron chaperone [Mycobacteriaceae bacterium]
MSTTPSTIDEYIQLQANQVQPILERIRSIIICTVPMAEEKISYGMPTISVNNQTIVHFAAWKNHISLYPLPKLSGELLKMAAPYLSGSSTAKFLLSQPIPFEIIQTLVIQLFQQQVA